MLLAKGKITQDMIALLDMTLDQAAAKGWIIVDMKRVWKKVFPPK